MRNYNQDAALLNKEERDAKKRQAVLKVFAPYGKGIRISLDKTVCLIMREWAIEDNYYAPFSAAITEWIRAEAKDPNGILGYAKGGNGGVFIRANEPFNHPPVNMTIQSHTATVLSSETKRAINQAIDKAVNTLLPGVGKSIGFKAEPVQAINNHVCPHCRNDKVSKDERSCWKCGGNL